MSRKTALVKFRCEPDLVEAVEEAARELRISPSEAGRTALKLWLEELDRVPDPGRIKSRLVQPVIEIGRRPGESDTDVALRRLHEFLARFDVDGV